MNMSRITYLLIPMSMLLAVGCQPTPVRPADETHSRTTTETESREFQPMPASNPENHATTADGHQVAIIAGGCFWGMEELLREIDGVLHTEVGYCGGQNENATYHNHPGHAEAVKITFDPKRISFQTLLTDWFFRMHDPTTLNRQGNDIGTSYRSTIFFFNDEQKQIAQQAIDAAAASGRWNKPITTTIEPVKNWSVAEEYHQDYLQKNPGGYTCHYLRP